MRILYAIRRLFSLNTLDTRFTTSSSTPPRDRDRVSNTNQNERDRQKNRLGVKPPLWKTPEFCVYIVLVVAAVLSMVKTGMDISKESHPNYEKYQYLLSPGWIPGRKVDNSDRQYASFRNNIPYLLVLLILHPLLRRLYEYIAGVIDGDSLTSLRPSSPARAFINPTRLRRRIRFDLFWSAIFLVALHGISAFKILMILYINFTIVTNLPRSQIPAFTWIFNIGTLFANELSTGYRFARIASVTAPYARLEEAINWGAWLDSFGGLIPRWEVLFNITVLRLISFNLDYYWSLDHGSSSPLEKKQLDPSNLSERDRISIPPPPSVFAFSSYLSYALYSPLYLAGPILTFNDYISQLSYPLPTISVRRNLMYGIRFLFCLLTMELMLHYIYAVAISKAQPAWEVYTPFQLSMVGYFNLHIIWLKLLLPWRFFRLWSLCDGIDPPENMVRCMSNNYSAMAFWRGWHRSFNRWITRYIYIPLGGSRPPPSSTPQRQTTLTLVKTKTRTILNFLLVFTFVALWHDINLRLLMWGWLITLFVLPEILAHLLFPARRFKTPRQQTIYRVLCGIGATFNILMMMVANLVGFALGTEGVKGLMGGIVGSWAGWGFVAAAFVVLYVGAQMMFEIREEEGRHGIFMKC
ncbi:MAG: hypothetical protein M1834_006130 [Cirrosporium novae-zelandiae]|nr:MAG: hypothetical protein M1834_006130 [Cirrosporium novae-zelandiae]